MTVTEIIGTPTRDLLNDWVSRSKHGFRLAIPANWPERGATDSREWIYNTPVFRTETRSSGYVAFSFPGTQRHQNSDSKPRIPITCGLSTKVLIVDNSCSTPEKCARELLSRYPEF